MSQSNRIAKVREFGALVTNAPFSNDLMTMEMGALTFSEVLLLVHIHKSVVRAMDTCQRRIADMENAIQNEGYEWQDYTKDLPVL